MSIFEAIMMLCFGFAWPFNIAKSYKSRTAKGKSVIFLWVIILGYVAGIIHKFLYSWDFTIYLYGINVIMVLIDVTLFYRNSYLDKLKKI